jgi:PAS domain S-box-containing protein
VGGIGSWETDLTTLQVSWSEQTHRIFETTAATFTPTHQAFLDFIHPDDRAAVETAFNASARECTSDTIDHRIVLRDGRIKYVEERWETFCDDTQAPVRAVGTCLDITERKQAELALRTSEQRFKRFMDQIPGLAYIKDANGRTLFANKGFTDLLGLRLEDMVGKQSADFFPADFAQKVDAEDREVLASGKTKELEENFGGRIWMTRKFPILTDGAAPMLAGITLDVTERRQTEETLKYREEIFSSIVGQANDAIALIDVETSRFIEFNRAAHDGLGYTREEFAGFRIADIHAKHDTERIREHIAQIMAEGGRIFETRHVRKNGEVRDVRISARPLQLRGRDYLAAVWGDITDARRMEQELQLSEARFRVLFEDISTVAIQGYRADGTTQFWNRASERFYGYTAKEAVGQNLRDLIIPPEMQSGVAEAMRQMAEHGTPIPAAELSLLRKDGSRIEVYSNHAIVQPPNRPAELFCMDVDLTSLKRAERILQQQAEELRLRNESLNRFNKVAVGREVRMIELKREINELCAKVGEAPRHRIPALEEGPR